ncbi:hypothetical protein HFP72_04915 [Nocardiopsis sp. ARC36]
MPRDTSSRWCEGRRSTTSSSSAPTPATVQYGPGATRPPPAKSAHACAAADASVEVTSRTPSPVSRVSCGRTSTQTWRPGSVPAPPGASSTARSAPERSRFARIRRPLAR